MELGDYMNKRRIIELIADSAGTTVEDILNVSGDTKLSDIGLESLQFVEFIVKLEKEFEIEIQDNDLILDNLETINTLFSKLEKYFVVNKEIKKILICDCDNCLWHGVAGEEKIYFDESTTALQNCLVDLYNRGVLLCLCSKNEICNIQTAFNSQGMKLKMENIIISKINFNNKVDNIDQIRRELHLSFESMVFIDDSDYEIGLVNALLPEITTIKIDYTKRLNTIINEIYSQFTLVSKNSNRTQQYKDQKLREQEKIKASSIEEYNRSLKSEITCRTALPEEADRIAELSQRTNQFNLSSKRYIKKEILDFLTDDDYTVFVLSAKDKYGDMGIVGAAVVHTIKSTEKSIVEAFFISCRVFERGFENILINKIKDAFPERLEGVYIRTQKNSRFKNFYLESGLKIYERK